MVINQIGILESQEVEACESIQDHSSKAFGQERAEGQAYEDCPRPECWATARAYGFKASIMNPNNHLTTHTTMAQAPQSNTTPTTSCLVIVEKDVSRHRHSPLIALT